LACHVLHCHIGVAIAIARRDDPAVDGVRGTPVEAGEAVLASVLPDGLSIYERDVVDGNGVSIIWRGTLV
jgi:hypothetical protein